MLVSNIYIDNNDQSFETPRKYNSSITAPGDHILLGFHYDRSFETPRINNHSVTETSLRTVLGGDISQCSETPQKTITVSLHQVPRFC